MNNIKYFLQYVNLIDGRTFYHYTEFQSMDELEEFVNANYERWTSFEVVVVCT